MRIIKIVLLFLALSWLIGLIYFYYQSKHHTINLSTKSDAIVLLSAKPQALSLAAELLKKNYAPLIVVAGNIDNSEISNFITFNKLIQEQFIFASSLSPEDIRNKSKSLSRNSGYIQNIKQLIFQYQFTNLRIVVLDIEWMRAIAELTQESPSGITYIEHPISLRPDYLNLFIEYHKYLFYQFMLIFGFSSEFSLSYS